MVNDKLLIGVLGGTFDPVHFGHIGLAKETFEKFGLDKILFIPVFQSPHKIHVPLVSSAHRIEMLRLAIKSNINFIISEVEARKEKISYTIDTLNYYELKFPDSELFLIIGHDNLLDLDLWKDAKNIMERFNILVASRPSQKLFSSEGKVLSFFNGQSPYNLSGMESGAKKFVHLKTGSRLIVFNIKPRDISSSLVRKKLEQGISTKNLLPPEVEAYIIKHQIYKTKF